jgi:hypothetical protein
MGAMMIYLRERSQCPVSTELVYPDVLSARGLFRIDHERRSMANLETEYRPVVKIVQDKLRSRTEMVVEKGSVWGRNRDVDLAAHVGTTNVKISI